MYHVGTKPFYDLPCFPKQLRGRPKGSLGDSRNADGSGWARDITGADPLVKEE